MPSQAAMMRSNRMRLMAPEALLELGDTGRQLSADPCLTQAPSSPVEGVDGGPPSSSLGGADFESLMQVAPSIKIQKAGARSRCGCLSGLRSWFRGSTPVVMPVVSPARGQLDSSWSVMPIHKSQKGPCFHELEVFGEHDLEEEQLDVLLMLSELQHCPSITLQKPPGIMRNCVYFMTPDNSCGLPMLPSVIKVKTAKEAQEEIDKTLAAQAHFGDYAMRLVDCVVLRSIGVLQLETSGSRCCIPEFVNAINKTTDFGRRFEEALCLQDEAKLADIMSATHELCGQVLRPAALKSLVVQRRNMLDDFGPGIKQRVLGTYPATKFGAPYFDGEGLSMLNGSLSLDGSTFLGYGGLITDVDCIAGRQLLVEMVGELTGQARPPSKFFADFFSSLEVEEVKSRLWMLTRYGMVHNDLHPGNLVIDTDDRIWVIDLESMGEGHVFTDLSKWLGTCLFCHAGPPETEQDITDMQSLLLLLASVPKDLRRWDLPDEESLSITVGFLWDLVRQMKGYFAEFATGMLDARLARDGLTSPRVRIGSDEQEVPKMEKPHFQLLWYLLSVAVQMVTYKQNSLHPQRKRLALFLAIAAATRILHELDVIPEPPWLCSYKWIKRQQNKERKATLSRARILERYMLMIQGREAWVRDPFTRQRFEVLQRTVDIHFSTPVGTSMGSDGVFHVLEESHRVLVLGSPGSGKTVLTKQCITQAFQSQSAAGRLPVRIALIALAAFVGNKGDLLVNYLRNTTERSVSELIHEARSTTGLFLILDGLDEASSLRERILDWLGNFLQEAPEHWVLMTSRPSSSPPETLRQILHGKWGFIVCHLQDFGADQLRSLCECRLGEALAKNITDQLLKKRYRALTHVPLLATMMMHMLVQRWVISRQRASSKEGRSNPVMRCDLFRFAFRQLLQHVDSAKWRAPSAYEVLVGMEDCLTELAYHKQLMRERHISESDMRSCTKMPAAAEALWRLAHSGQLALFEAVDKHVQFFHLTMQEYLAAEHVWRLILDGNGLPQWLLNRDDFAVGTGRFVAALAERHRLPPGRYQQLRLDFSRILWNVRQDAEATRGLVKLTPPCQVPSLLKGVVGAEPSRFLQRWFELIQSHLRGDELLDTPSVTLTLLNEQEWKVRDITLRVLLALSQEVHGDHKVVSSVSKLLEDTDFEVRNTAIKTLVAVAVRGDEVAVHAALERLQHEDAAVRGAGLKALMLLAEPGDSQAIEAARSMLQDSLPSVRCVALKGLVALAPYADEPSIEAVRPLLSDKDWYTKRSAIEVLAKLAQRGDARSIADVISQLRMALAEERVVKTESEELAVADKGLELQAECLRALAEVAERGHPEAVQLTLEMVHRSSAKKVRKASIKALARLATRGDAAAVGSLCTILDGEMQDVIVEAVKALAAVAEKGNHQAIGCLRAMLMNRQAAWRLQAVYSLLHLARPGDVAIIESLAMCLGDDDFRVRKAVASVILELVVDDDKSSSARAMAVLAQCVRDSCGHESSRRSAVDLLLQLTKRGHKGAATALCSELEREEDKKLCLYAMHELSSIANEADCPGELRDEVSVACAALLKGPLGSDSSEQQPQAFGMLPSFGAMMSTSTTFSSPPDTPPRVCSPFAAARKKILDEELSTMSIE